MTAKLSKNRALRTRGPDHEDRERVPKHKRRKGRPTVYDERVTIVSACFMARHGATDIEIADELGIAVGTLYRWYNEHPEFREAVSEAKDAQNERVKRALAQRATGYEFTEYKLHQGKVIPIRAHMPADPGAAMNWLKNRDRQNWRDTREIDLVVPDTNEEGDDVDIRQLALAAINLLGDAADAPLAPNTIDLIANEETEDGEAAEAQQDEEDIDFDRE